MKPATFNCTVLRDGHQSLAATRMSTEQMLELAPILDTMGFSALETWGGASIDAGLRFLGEFPFDRLDTLKKLAPKTPHSMLLRGQNLVGYTHYADDVVEAFVKMSVKHGMNIFRIFDCLNDPQNMRTSIQAAKAAGATAHGAICYTTSPVHNLEYFAKLGKEIADMGADGIVIKDMAGLIPPKEAADLVTALKKFTGLPVWIHTHDTAGIGASTYVAAMNAGADAVDVSISPFANGTAQPDCLRMLALMQGYEACPVVADDFKAKLTDISARLQPIYESLCRFTGHKNEVVNSDTLRYQVPGGMLSNFRNQLKEMNMTDKFEEVFAEIPVVRKALGWIPLVTPTSQIVGVQAMMNVKFGRWKNITPQCADVALGYYGRTPAPVDPELQKLCAEKMKKDPITCRPADLIKPGMQALRDKLAAKGMPTTDEWCVIYAMFPQQLEDYHNGKKPEPPTAPAKKPAEAAPAASAVAPTTVGLSASINGKDMKINLLGKTYDIRIEEF